MPLDLFLPVSRSPEGRGGKLRRVLARLGPSWSQAPARRAAQAAALVLFAYLFFYVCWPHGARLHAQAMRAREFIEAETFLALDPLASVSTALAAKTWVWSLSFAAIVLLSGLLWPRGFCGYLCPLGTLIDLFDWAVGRRFHRFHLRRSGERVWLRYYVLTAVLVAAAFGTVLSGFVAAIPVLTRGMQFSLAPVQTGLLRGWQAVAPMNLGQAASLVLFGGVFALGVLGPRFWCRRLCPTGAMISLASLLRLSERRVSGGCIGCGRCLESCGFDAINDGDFTTRHGDCTFCQSCGGACPAGAIHFTTRWSRGDWKVPAGRPEEATSLSRRGFLAGTAGGLAAVLGFERLFAAARANAGHSLPVRPPGAVPEDKFLQMCVRCGSCLKACPTGILQPLGWGAGLPGLWTPHAVGDWAGCDPTCNICGQVCPTGAIRALKLEEKSAARMGLAAVNESTCLPHADRGDCQLCVDACRGAGYEAIEFVRVGAEIDEQGAPVEDSGRLAPVVLPERCVGCGLCQSRCYQINVRQRGALGTSAIRVQAGRGREDRIMRGSYRALRQAEEKARQQRLLRQRGGQTYLPGFLQD